jgi:hypothetical protein
VYSISIAMKGTAVAAAGTPYSATFEIESANGPTVIAGHTHLVKGGGIVNWMDTSHDIYMGSFINNQNLSVFLTPDTNINIYDIGFIIQRNYLES